jgi:O-methyltransferase
VDARARLRSISPAAFHVARASKLAFDAVRAFPLRKYPEIPHTVSTYMRVNDAVPFGHEHREMLEVASAIYSLPRSVRGVFVEAGSFKGASAAKLSIACAHMGRKMHIFDSFEGLPPTKEDHGANIWGVPASFSEGEYAGSLKEVKEAIRRFGVIDICEFHKGWFEETLPTFKKWVAGAYLDVDLQSSTRTCIRYLYPLLQPGGFIFSQDGHLPLIIELLSDKRFWVDEVGTVPPVIHGLGKRKLIRIEKATT